MMRTSVILDTDMMLKLRRLAALEEKTITAVIREALANHLDSKLEKRPLSFIGIGRSGKGNLSRDVEKILRQKARRRRDW